MYADPGLLLPFFEGFSLLPPSPPPPIRQLPHHQIGLPLSGELPGVGTVHLGNLVHPSTVLEYDLGGEGDLFNAPEPIIEETLLTIDPVCAAMSIMSGGDDVISNTIKVSDVQTIHNEIQNVHILSDIFYECKKDLEEYAIGDAVQEPGMAIKEAQRVESGEGEAQGQLQKSISMGSFYSVEWINGGGRPNFLGFQGLDFEAAYGMRRAYSEGDIQKLGNANASFPCTNAMCSPLEQLLPKGVMGDLKSEERRQKLSRYMKKKTKRNFGRKIKYACRKALADSQPRVRGRFARPEEYENSKQQK